MRNIEIKAAIGDPRSTEARAEAMAAPDSARLFRQVDTYFRIPEGRLKLREKSGAEKGAELIFYSRPDVTGPKPCDYEIAPVDEPHKLKGLLAEALGIRTVVSKSRKVFLFENARIHIDQVDGLGSFLEIEVVMAADAPDDTGESLMHQLMEALAIDPEDLLDCSYCDLQEKNL
jgi:predicted adenylyl cyclase CyaB